MTVENFFETILPSKPSSLIDEDQLAKTFQEIVNCVNMDDDNEPVLPTPSGFNAAVGSHRPQSHVPSFLDDDWVPIVKRIPSSGSSILSINPCTTISEREAVTPSTQSATSTASTRPVTPFASYSAKPPVDYICKLCSNPGHWMKDCRLFEPRTPPASFKSTASSSSFSSSGSNAHSVNSFSSNSSSTAMRTPLPPSNYICRLCNISGHWIDQCAKFQPKLHSNLTRLPPMLGPGPTPNYRPPAYLSKPVPSNYVCNLCQRPGHWIQQCTEFTPIIKRRES